MCPRLPPAGGYGPSRPPGGRPPLVRNPARARSLAERGVQVRAADYDRPDTLPAALDGVERLLLISGNAVGQRAVQHRNVVAAAAGAGVGRVVYTSIAHADRNTMPLGEEHRVTEQVLGESGLPAVVLRNSWYVENFTDQLPQYLQAGAVVGATGDARIAAAPRDDYAEAAAAALLDDAVDRAGYELGGPLFTMPELAAALSEATGRELPYRDVPLEDFRAGLLAAGLDAATADFVTALERGTARGELDVDPADLERLLGRPATDLRTAVRALVGAAASGRLS